MCELLGREGNEVVEEAWVSDLDTLTAFQSHLVLRVAAHHLSCDLLLTGVWTPVNRIPGDFVEEDSQVPYARM